jgi:A/G-specific adenine glycosylase
MLQQTRVETVIPYYERFLAKWPSVRALAEAPLGDVLAAWSGLGYYRRARMLHAAAEVIAQAPAFPGDAASLSEVKGIGRYTAGAVASIAYGERAPLVDGNVARVFARLFAIEDDVRSARGIAKLWALAEDLVDAGDPGAWNQALMELGATVCVPREPRCLVCPVRQACEGRALGRERVLPRLAPKAKPRVQARWALVAKQGESVLLGRRHPDVRFGGLWEPPSIDVDVDAESESEASASRRFAALTGMRFSRVTRAGEVTHVLSHRRLEVDVLRAVVSPGTPRAPSEPPSPGGEYAAFELIPASRMRELGMSTFAKKILAADGGDG